MVVRGDEAVRLPVQDGFREGGLVEVTGEGLTEGMTIVTEEAYSLPSVTKIHIIGR
jgi:membrane fusion protein (multidrug efflux system)